MGILWLAIEPESNTRKNHKVPRSFPWPKVMLPTSKSLFYLSSVANVTITPFWGSSLSERGIYLSLHFSFFLGAGNKTTVQFFRLSESVWESNKVRPFTCLADGQLKQRRRRKTNERNDDGDWARTRPVGLSIAHGGVYRTRVEWGHTSSQSGDRLTLPASLSFSTLMVTIVCCSSVWTFSANPGGFPLERVSEKDWRERNIYIVETKETNDPLHFFFTRAKTLSSLFFWNGDELNFSKMETGDNFPLC